MSDVLEEIRESFEYDRNKWEPIRKNGKKNMQFVAGDPWDAEDKKLRDGRPTVAPEEMGQYFNQVINQLRANPRGMKFAPTGNGASEAGARFYQNKAREIEYRSHAKVAYIAAAENAIQRSYGFLRVNVRYGSPRSPNQELVIEDFPNPDMVMPDTDAKRPDSSDAKRFWVFEWIPQTQFKREHKDAKLTNFGDWQSTYPSFIQGNQVLRTEFWKIKTTKRVLVMVTPPPMPAPNRMIAPQQTAPQPIFAFADELEGVPIPPGASVKELRDVDYPEVWTYLTNGLEILNEQQWPGKYIPIVSCYGKIIYIDGDQGMERKILAMTDFGRDPWKSFCYASSQQLEIIGQTPKASVMAAVGQLAGYEQDWNEAPYKPKSVLYYHLKTEEGGAQLIPPPQRIPYLQADNLQALEMVKEGFRRSIQAAMGSNFLPSQAQRRNEKSGVALDKIQQAAATGTFHFVNNYDDMIRRTAEICEDLIDKIYDYAGETGTMEADGAARMAVINTPGAKDNVDTKGDYLVTVSTAPSSDSEQDAAESFTDALVGNLATVAQVSGPKAAAAVLAKSIRMRNLGPQGDQLADLIEPPEYKQKDGQPPNPEVQAAKAEAEKLGQMLQQAGKVIETKQIEQKGQFDRDAMKADKDAALQIRLKQMDLDDNAKDRAAKIEVARISAAKQSADLNAEALEERLALGVETVEAAKDRVHEAHMAHLDKTHERDMAALGHEQNLEAAEQGQVHALDQMAAEPPPEASV